MSTVERSAEKVQTARKYCNFQGVNPKGSKINIARAWGKRAAQFSSRNWARYSHALIFASTVGEAQWLGIMDVVVDIKRF